MRAPLVIAAAVFLSLVMIGCAEEFTPASTVDKLRVLGIRSEPAELRPGGTATVSALVLDPSRPGKRNTLVWFSCDPDPLNLGRSACSDLGELSDPTSLVSTSANGALELPPGMRLAGFGDTAVYTAPADLFAQLPAEDERRRTGSVAQLLLMAIAEEVSPAASREELDAVLARVRSGEVDSIISIFRVRVTEEEQLNQNPRIEGIALDGIRVPTGAHLRVQPGAVSPLSVEAVAEGEDEKLIAAWYTTAGGLADDRVALGEGRTATFTAPGADDLPIPESRRGQVWAVVRDTRGGQSWLEVPLFVCEPLGPAPVVRSVSLENSEVRLEGEHLDRILDVTVGGQALGDPAFSTVKSSFGGVLPQLSAGEHPMVLRLRDCTDVVTGQNLPVFPTP